MYPIFDLNQTSKLEFFMPHQTATFTLAKDDTRILYPVQQPGSNGDRPSQLSPVGGEANTDSLSLDTNLVNPL